VYVLRGPLARRAALMILATVVGAVAAVVAFQPGGAGDPVDVQMGAPPVGAARPAAELAAIPFEELGGTATTLGDLHGRPVVVNFFASWCAPCRTEMPHFERVHREVRDDVTFLGLAVRDRPEDVRALIVDTGVTYRIGRDLDDRALVGVGALGPLPVTAFVDEDGTVLQVLRGELDEERLRALLAEHFGIGST
jgi:cytochrome c biogenesis protein CcmG, thiol:disulfide interchange protein DsbE